MAVTLYRSQDPSAPALSGTVGSLVALLDAVLVNGYGAKAAAGWTKPYTATNQATFKPGAGVQHFFHIDDNSPNATALAREAQVRGSEAASAVLTGAGFFPSVAQIAVGAGNAIRKSATADSTARAWAVIADNRTCHLFIISGDSAGVWCGYSFGEIYSVLSTTDNYRSITVGRNANQSTAADNLSALFATTSGGPHSNHYMARAYTGLGSSIAVGKTTDAARSYGASSIGGSGPTAPDAITGAVLIAPVNIHEGGLGNVRGRLRGLFSILHAPTPFADGDTIVGSGAYTGRTFLVLKPWGTGPGMACFDQTGPWETN